jgi:hypothetical protein
MSTTDIPTDLLLQQGRLVLTLILSHAGLFVVGWLLLRMVKSISGTASIVPWQQWSYYSQPGTKQSNQKPLLCLSSRHSLW